MSISINVNKEMLEQLKVKLSAARDDLKNNGAVMMQVAAYLDQWVQQNFASGGGKVGGWEPFKYGGRLSRKDKSNAQSLEGKKWVNGTAKLLMDTGALRLSFLPFVRMGVAGIGSDLPYSKPHQEGTKDLPQRRMLPEHKDVDADILEIMNGFILARIKKANA